MTTTLATRAVRLSAPAPATPAIVAVDPGNATTTAISADGRAVFFPSFVASRGVRPFAGRVSEGYHHLSYQGREYLVGDAALSHGRYETLLAEMDAGRAWERYIDRLSVVTLLTAICAATDAPTVELATGAPQSFEDATLAAIGSKLTGTYEVIYNGQPRTITIRAARVYREAASLLGLISDLAGYGIVHDVGGRTWQPVPYRDGRMLGTPRSWDEGTDRLLDLAGVNTDPGARWALVAEMRRNVKAHPAIRESIAGAVNALLDEKNRRINIDAADRHIVAGGLAPVLVPILQARYRGKRVEAISERPEASNAIAYLKAAMEVR